MGTPGVPWNKDNATIVTAIKKHKGRLTHIAKDPTIDCAVITVRTRINNTPELKDLLQDVRNHWVESTLDKAEDVLTTLMDGVQEDRGCALKAAMFALNNLGKERGYSEKKKKAANAQYQF